MRKSFSIIALLVAFVAVPFLAGCSTTANNPQGLTGAKKEVPVYNDKNRTIGYQAR